MSIHTLELIGVQLVYVLVWGALINIPKKKEWYLLFLDEPYLTKEDIDQYTARRKIKP